MSSSKEKYEINVRDKWESVISLSAIFPLLLSQLLSDYLAQKVIIGIAAILLFSFKKQMATYIVNEPADKVLFTLGRGFMVAYLAAMYVAVAIMTFLESKTILFSFCCFGVLCSMLLLCISMKDKK
jgi:hypothetical protein